jgi:iron complex outermembrane receptor protein
MQKKKLALAIGLLGVVMTPAIQAQQLEEVLVTAQLREENIQDVPVAVSAVSGATLEDNSLKDLLEMQTSVPSLLVGVNQSSSTANFSIRGVGTGAQNFGLESSVGLYVDGVYRARQSSVINQLVDVEAVEILRGPQGTFFGKNSASGSVLMRTVRPSNEQNGFVDMTVGNLGLVNLSAAGNYRVTDNTNARSTLFFSSRDGFINEGSSKDINDRDRWGFRQQFLYEGDNDLSLRAIVDYAKIDEVCCAALTLKDSFVASGRTENGAPVPGTDYILSMLGGTIFRSGSFADNSMAVNQLPRSQSKDRGVSIEVNKRVRDLDFVSVTAYRRFDTNDFIDADFSDVDLASRTYGAEQSMFTQEFRVSTNADNPVRLTAGAFIYKQDINSDDKLPLGSMLPNYVLAASKDLTTLVSAQPLLGFMNLAWGTAFPAQFAPHIASGNIIHDQSTQEHEANALFTRVDIDISDQLELNIGLRYTSEKKTMLSTFEESIPTPGPGALNLSAIGAAFGIAEAQYKAFLGAPPGDGSGVTFNAALAQMNPAPYVPALSVLFQPGWANCTVTARFCPRPDINAKLNDDRVTGNVGLTFRPNDSTMIYASYGTGYKSGGTNTDRIGLGFDTVFDAEDSKNYEVGLKQDIGNNLRMNLALYRMDVDNLQTNTFTGTAFNLQNAGVAEVSGFEAEIWWNPLDSLDLRLAYSYTDATYDNFDKGNCQISNIFHTGNVTEASQYLTKGYCNRNGDQLGNVPEHFASLQAVKQFNIAGNGLSVSAEYVYYSETFMISNNDPFALQDAVSLLNLNATLSMDNDLELLAWGRNLTDESWFGTVFDTPLQDGKLSAYPREPRTFGLTLRKSF